MIYTVTFNPSLDYIVSVDEFTCGKVNRTTEELMFPGGKGINVSQVLTNLGVENTALGYIAGFTGKHLEEVLREQGILSDFIQVKNGMTRINVKLRSKTHKNIDLQEQEICQLEETEINGQGPLVSEEELKCLMNKIEQLTSEDILVVSGSVCKGVSQNIYADIVKLCNDKTVKVVVDASGALLRNALEFGPFLIKPNHHELGDVFGRDINSRDEIIFYARELQNRGAKNVLVSMGGKGAILVAEDGEVYESKAPKGTVTNSVGAGDSMVAGFLTGYLDTNDYEAALQMGICTGSASAFSEGLATRKMVGKLLREALVEMETRANEAKGVTRQEETFDKSF